MTINAEQAEQTFNEEKEHWAGLRSTVKQLCRYLRVPQVDIAECLHMSRQTLNTRLNGSTEFKPWEISTIAVALNVPRDVLDMSPEDAVRYVLDHPEEFPKFRWSPLSSQHDG